jgi:hypothetical protein
MKSKTQEMQEEIKKPFIKKMIDGLLRHEELEREIHGKTMPKVLATAADSALYNLPSKNQSVKKYVDDFRNESPHVSQLASLFGDIVGSTAVGGAAVKGLSKIGKLKKILSGTKWTNTAARSAAYNAASEVADKTTHKTHQPVSEDVRNILTSGIGGYALGGLGHGLGLLIKPVVKTVAKVNPMTTGKQIKDDVGRELFQKLDKRTINHARHIVNNPIESKSLNLNTLLHRGNEETIGMIDDLYQRNPKVRTMIARETKKLTEGQMPHIRESIIRNSGLHSRPDVDTFVKNSKRKINAVTDSLYDKANKVGEIDVPERLKNAPRFKPAVDQAYKEMNLLDKGKPTYEEHSLRNLHVAKDYLHDDVKKFGASGDNRQKKFAEKTYHDLRDVLNEASPDYKKATSIYKKYFDIQRAAESGRDFKAQNIDEMIKNLEKMGGREKHAYKTGAVQSLLEKAEARSQNAKLAELGKDFTNSEIKRKLEKIIGEESLSNIVKDIDASNAAVKNFGGISQGSDTAKHMSNKAIFSNILNSLKGSSKGVINLIFGAAQHVKDDKAKREALLKMHLFMNPKKLLQYANVPTREGSNIIPTMIAIKNKDENATKRREDEENARWYAKQKEERAKKPLSEKSTAEMTREEINAKYDKKRDEIRRKYYPEFYR